MRRTDTSNSGVSPNEHTAQFRDAAAHESDEIDEPTTLDEGTDAYAIFPSVEEIEEEEQVEDSEWDEIERALLSPEFEDVAGPENLARVALEMIPSVQGGVELSRMDDGFRVDRISAGRIDVEQAEALASDVYDLVALTGLERGVFIAIAPHASFVAVLDGRAMAITQHEPTRLGVVLTFLERLGLQP